MTLDSATLPLGSVPDVLDWWRDNAPRFPILSRMARDFLAVPASGVGVENLFSTARDVCHYRCNRLAPETIEAIMIQMSADRFQLKHEYTLVEDGDNDEPKDIGYQDLEVELDVNYISEEEDLGGFEEDDGDCWGDDDEDDRLGLPSVQSYQRPAVHPPVINPTHQPGVFMQQSQPAISRVAATIPQSHPTTGRPRRVTHEPGYFQRLDNGR